MKITKSSTIVDKALPAKVKAAVSAYVDTGKGNVASICYVANISPTTFYRLQKGEMTSISFSTLRRLATAVEADDCFGVRFEESTTPP